MTRAAWPDNQKPCAANVEGKVLWVRRRDLRDCPARPVQGGGTRGSSFQGADVGLPCRATSAPASDTSSDRPRRPAVLLCGSVAPSDFGNLICSIACRRGGRAVLPSP